MHKFPWALAMLALFGASPALAAAPEAAASEKAAPETPRSPDARRVIDWIAATGDNHGLPYAIVDKQAAHVFLFDARGNALADAPVLIGIAPGDDATPGVGKKSLAEIGPAEKTTPAGRFLAKFGLAAGKHFSAARKKAGRQAFFEV